MMSKLKIKRPRDTNRLAHAVVQESISRFEERGKKKGIGSMNETGNERCEIEGYYRPRCQHYEDEDAIVMVLKGGVFPETCIFECKVPHWKWELVKGKEF